MTIIIQLYSHSRIIALFYCHNTAAVRNQRQLPTCKTSKWHSLLLFLKTKFFQIYFIIKNFTNCKILKHFAFKNHGKLANHDLEKLCP